MSNSLFELLTEQLAGPAVSQISRQIGTDDSKTAAAIPDAVGALMGALAGNTRRQGGAEALAGALARDHDGSILDDLAGFIPNSSQGPGDAILRHILGSQRATVESNLSQKTGLDAGSIGKLMTMLAPIVLGMLGRNQRQQKLDPGGLSDLLNMERRTVQKRAPGGVDVLGSLLDMDGDGQVADDVAKLGSSLLGRLFRRR